MKKLVLSLALVLAFAFAANAAIIPDLPSDPANYADQYGTYEHGQFDELVAGSGWSPVSAPVWWGWSHNDGVDHFTSTKFNVWNSAGLDESFDRYFWVYIYCDPTDAPEFYQGYNTGAGADYRDITQLDTTGYTPTYTPTDENWDEDFDWVLYVFMQSPTGYTNVIEFAEALDGYDIEVYAKDVIPEPTSMLLLGLGVVGLLRYRRKK